MELLAQSKNKDRSCKESIDLLMDHELPEQDRDKISQLVLAEPLALGFHDLRTRRSGTMVFIQLHLELDASLRLSAAHEIADRLENKLANLFPNAEVIIHEDPVEVSS